MSEYFYVELDIQDDEALESLESEAFKSYQCSGTQDFAIDEPKVDEILGERSYSGGDLPREVLDEVESVLKSEGELKKVFYFPDEATAVKFHGRLRALGYENESCVKSEVSKDWNESWKKSFKRIPVNDSLTIVPSWENLKDGKREILIYPGMGFGTGNHETTFLCLKLMLEELSNKADIRTCLDFGCGSGILGIGFSQIFSRPDKVDYLDIDSQALENCELNIGLNELASRTPHGIFLSEEKNSLLESYDLVFANILLDALLAEAETILEVTGSYLIISGLLKGQENEVVRAYKKMIPSIETVKVLTRNDWSAALLKLNKEENDREEK